jgi:hypothetical protein
MTRMGEQLGRARSPEGESPRSAKSADVSEQAFKAAFRGAVQRSCKDSTRSSVLFTLSELHPREST